LSFFSVCLSVCPSRFSTSEIVHRISPRRRWSIRGFAHAVGFAAARRCLRFLVLSACLFVCLSITLLNVRVCASDFAMKALEYRNDFDAIGYGKVCSCAPMFHFLRLLLVGDNTKCRSSKNGQNCFFSPPQGDRINRSRRNLAGKRTPWVCSSTLNLALIGKRGSVQGPQNVKICSKL